jgi:hypothetical protein
VICYKLLQKTAPTGKQRGRTNTMNFTLHSPKYLIKKVVGRTVLIYYT